MDEPIETTDTTTTAGHAAYNQDIGPMWAGEALNPHASALVKSGKPTDEMTTVERFHWDMNNILGILSEMNAIIEGGECFEDFESTAACQALGEIHNFITNRTEIVTDNIKGFVLVQELQASMTAALNADSLVNAHGTPVNGESQEEEEEQ